MKNRIFISHAKEDTEKARSVHAHLLDAGYAPWLAAKDLKPGQTWEELIEFEIARSRYVIALLSSRSLAKRGYVQREIRLALDIVERLPIRERFLIPARLDECEPLDPRLARLHWIDLFPNYLAGVATLLAGIEEEDRAIRSFYCDVGIEVPADIHTWPDDRLFCLLAGELEDEAMQRARRDWEGMPEADDPSCLRDRVDEKLEAVAYEKGFIGGWRRYLSQRRESAS